VRGNIDIGNGRYVKLFEGTGFHVLDNESVGILRNGETFYISGVRYDYPQRAQEVLQRVPKDRFSIFLFHSPDLFEELGDHNYDLYLCGHTHGGQVALPFFGAVITLSQHWKKYEAGKYVRADKTLYVNRGIGMEGGRFAPRVRFFARPEISVFDIHPLEKK
jgi:predicted MPP superfamily phosphohydrolase